MTTCGGAHRENPWIAHFAEMSVESGADFGTILGFYSFSDVNDLIKAKDTEIQALGNSFSKNADAWRASDPAGYADWKKDWDALMGRYQHARTAARDWIDGTQIVPLPDNLRSADPQYQNIMRAIAQNWSSGGGPGARAKGDLADLGARLVASGTPLVKYSVPQPSHSDADTHIQHAIEHPSDLIPTLPHVDIPWFKIALIGTGVLLGVTVLAKSAATVAAKVAIL
jgi:hypothetical protein